MIDNGISTYVVVCLHLSGSISDSTPACQVPQYKTAGERGSTPRQRAFCLPIGSNFRQFAQRHTIFPARPSILQHPSMALNGFEESTAWAISKTESGDIVKDAIRKEQVLK